MKKLLFIFLFLLAAVWIGIMVYRDHGYVLISYRHWTLETTLWFSLLALAFFFFLIVLLSKLIRGVFGLSQRISRWSHQRYERRMRRWTHRGLSALVEGDWQTAETYLLRGAKHPETKLINYLAAARAAQAIGAYERRDSHLRKAANSNKDAEVAVAFNQALLQVDSKQWEQALATLRHLTQVMPNHAYVLKLLQGVYFELQDWHSLRELLPKLRHQNILSEKELSQLEEQVYSSLLVAAVKQNNQKEVTDIWQNMPHYLQEKPKLLLIYVDYLRAHQAEPEAAQFLREALKKTWDTELVRRYGLVHEPDAAKQLKTAEGWLKQHPNDSVLLLTLGRLCRRNRLWGKARSYLEASVRFNARPESYWELGQIFEQLDEKNSALDCYRKGLQQK